MFVPQKKFKAIHTQYIRTPGDKARLLQEGTFFQTRELEMGKSKPSLFYQF